MTLDWSTLALQVVNFLILAWLLHRFLYRPVLAAIDRRRAETVARQDQAAEAQRRGEAAERDWRQRVLDLDSEATARIRAAEAEGERRAAALMAEAHRQAERHLAETRAGLDGERTAARAELAAEAAAVAVTLAARLLDQVAPGVGPEPFLRALEARLAALDPDERSRLAAGADDTRVAVAPPLTADATAEWRHRLGLLVGPVVFVDTPALIAGARLDGAAARIEVSWFDALNRARQEMERDAGSP